MKKFFRVIGVMLILLCSLAQPVTAVEYQPEITIAMDGQFLPTDVPPIIQNNYTLVPLRTVAEALKLEVSWNAGTQEIQLAGNGRLDLIRQLRMVPGYRWRFPRSYTRIEPWFRSVL